MNMVNKKQIVVKLCCSIQQLHIKKMHRGDHPYALYSNDSRSGFMRISNCDFRVLRPSVNLRHSFAEGLIFNDFRRRLRMGILVVCSTCLNPSRTSSENVPHSN